jgi:hypothetical protein
VKGNHPKEAGEQLLRPIPISEPFAGVGMDLLGPLQTTRSGHRFIKWGDRLPLEIGRAPPLVDQGLRGCGTVLL